MRIALLIPIVIGLVTGAVAVANPSGALRRDDDRVPVAIPAGPARDCVSVAALHDSVVRSDRVIDFMTGGRSAYRVVLPQGCPSLGSERRFAYETSLNQLCSTDIITVLYETPLGRGPSCGLAPFQPVTFPKR